MNDAKGELWVTHRKNLPLPCNLFAYLTILVINTPELERAVTIESLYEGCKGGNRHAQEQLYNALASKLLGVCMRYASSTFEAEIGRASCRERVCQYV